MGDSRWRRAWAAAVLASLSATVAAADDPAPWRGAIELSTTDSDAHAGRLAVTRDGLAAWRLGSLRLALGAEATAGTWYVKPGHRDGRTWFGVAGAGGIVRVGETSGPFAQLGLSANAIAPRFHTMAREFGTVFNFGSHLGLGWRFGGERAWELMLRAEHFSNASIKQPNPGENFYGARVGVAF